MIDLLEAVGVEVTFERIAEGKEELEDGFSVSKTTPIKFVKLVTIQPRSGFDLETEERGERERIEFDVIGFGDPLQIHDKFTHFGKKHEINNVRIWPGHFEAISAEIQT